MQETNGESANARIVKILQRSAHMPFIYIRIRMSLEFISEYLLHTKFLEDTNNISANANLNGSLLSILFEIP